MNLPDAFARLLASDGLLLNPTTQRHGLRAFSVIAPQLWNELPMATRSTDNINIS